MVSEAGPQLGLAFYTLLVEFESNAGAPKERRLTNLGKQPITYTYFWTRVLLSYHGVTTPLVMTTRGINKNVLRKILRNYFA